MVNPIICRCAPYGLGNKLLFIASAMRMCDILKRPMIIEWEKAEHCDCVFSDLFQPIDGIEVRDFNTETEPINDSDSATIPDLPFESCVIFFSGYIHLQGEKKSFKDLSQYFEKIRPLESIQQKINEFKNQHDFQNIIGVHFRETDKGKNIWKTRFFETCEQIVKRSTYNLFLSADNPEIEIEFKKRFGDRVVFYIKNNWTVPTLNQWYEDCMIHRGIECMVESVVDMWLLAQTRVILYGLGTFPACAAKIKNAPLVPIAMEKNILFFHYDKTEMYKTVSVNEVVQKVFKLA